MTWKHIDFEGRVAPKAGPSLLFTKTKTHDDRRVPLSDEAVAGLRRLQVQTLQSGQPFGRTMEHNIVRRWARVLAEAGIPYVTIHELRKTFVTRLVRAEVNIKALQLLAGHRSTQTTLKY